MKKEIARAPTRIDLAGGTLDIWPINMLVDRAVTINVAIDLFATVEVEPLPKGDDDHRVVLHSVDSGVEEEWPDVTSPPKETRLPLLAECVRFVGPKRGFRLTAHATAPKGSGLGGSSSLAVSLLGGLEAWSGGSMTSPEETIAVARDLEARVLQTPTGCQDHYAAAFGGAAAIHHGPGRPTREALPIDLEDLGARLVLIYTGATRLSALANWDMVRRALDGDGETRKGLQAIASIAQEMRGALMQNDLESAGRLMEREWEERRNLSPRVATETIVRAIDAARKAGALAGKVCGAGGGGCVAFFCRDGARRDVAAAMEGLAAEGITLLEARPTPVGLTLAG